METTLCV